MSLKENIKKRRLENGMTLDAVAQIVGVTRQTVQKYESGLVSNIPSDKIELLAKALKTTPARLMGWGDNNTDSFSDNGEAAADSDLLQAQISTFGDAREYSEAEIAEIKSFLRFIKQKRNDE